MSYDSKLMEKMIHRSTVCYCQIVKFPTKRLFWIVLILRTDGMAPFCNLFMEWPSYFVKNSDIIYDVSHRLRHVTLFALLGNTRDAETSHYRVWWTATQGQWSRPCCWWRGKVILSLMDG